MPESCYMGESYLWFLFFAKIFSNYFLSISGDYLLASVLCKCSTAFDICQILNHSIQSYSNIVRKRTVCGDNCAFLVINIIFGQACNGARNQVLDSSIFDKLEEGGKKRSIYVDDVCKCLQVFFMLFRGKDNHFQEKQKSPWL